MKVFVLIVSKQFPKTHNRSGENTRFVESIKMLFHDECEKIHSLRHNYELWRKRAKEINEGKAILSIRYWDGKPYRSKQVEICRLERIGVEKLEDPTNLVFATIGEKMINWGEIAKNDGLSFEDFCEWFKIRTKQPMAVIHFTNFRYCDNGIQLTAGGDFGAVNCQYSMNLNRSTKPDLTTLPPLLPNVC